MCYHQNRDSFHGYYPHKFKPDDINLSKLCVLLLIELVQVNIYPAPDTHSGMICQKRFCRHSNVES